MLQQLHSLVLWEQTNLMKGNQSLSPQHISFSSAQILTELFQMLWFSLRIPNQYSSCYWGTSLMKQKSSINFISHIFISMEKSFNLRHKLPFHSPGSPKRWAMCSGKKSLYTFIYKSIVKSFLLPINWFFHCSNHFWVNEVTQKSDLAMDFFSVKLLTNINSLNTFSYTNKSTNPEIQTNIVDTSVTK